MAATILPRFPVTGYSGYDGDRAVLSSKEPAGTQAQDLAQMAPRAIPRRLLFAALLCMLVLPFLGGAAPAGSGTTRHDTLLSPSRWWRLECDAGHRPQGGGPEACVFTLRLRGLIDGSRLQLVRHAVWRLAALRHTLGPEVGFRVDVDSPGGEIFSALEIGRMLRDERGSVSVGKGASCVSSCVFLLMGSTERHVSPEARLGIHRPSLRGRPRGGPDQASEEAVVAAMTDQLVSYAREMGVGREIVDALMSVPPDRVEPLSRARLVRYGIHLADGTGEGSAHSRLYGRR